MGRAVFTSGGFLLFPVSPQLSFWWVSFSSSFLSYWHPGPKKKPPRKLREIGQQALQPFCRASVLWSRPILLSTESLQSNNHHPYKNPPHLLCTSSGRFLIFYHWLEGCGGISPTLSGKPSPTTWLVQTKITTYLDFYCQNTAAPRQPSYPLVEDNFAQADGDRHQG